MSIKKTVFTLLAACLSLSSGGRAEDLSGRWGIGGWGGLAVPLAPEKTIEKPNQTGTDFGGGVRLGLSPHWGLDLAYDNLKLKDDKKIDDGVVTNVRVQPVTLALRYSFNPDGNWMPFLRAGVGTTVTKGLKPGARYANVLGAKAGLGLEYFVCSYFSLAAAVDYFHITRGVRTASELNAVSPTLAATVFFGGGAAPEPQMETADIPQPAPVESPPLVDSDGDGVFDDDDQCADTPKGATVDAPGCPSDADNDGVFDGLDKCPDTAENRLVDKEGCPLPEKVVIQLRLIFDSGKAELKPEHDTEIAKVAEFMSDYPTTVAEIEGHTDSVGKPASNILLSQKRADSVRQRLIQTYGIDAARLTAKGYGSSRPVADNTTAEGRAMNRRVVATVSAMKK